MLPEEFELAVISSIVNLSTSVKEFTFITNKPVNFIPGQFIVLKINNVERSYSISSKLNINSCEFQIIVSLNPSGIISPILFKMEIGNTILISIPKGTFTLPETLPKSIYFICTGTGLAPFKSMIESILIHSNSTIHLIYGNRTFKDILYHTEWLKLKELHSNFSYYPVLSQEDWKGEKGYVHSIYMQKLILNPNSMFYVCGWQNMLEDCRNNLKSLGFTRKQYKFEQYN